MYLCSSKVWYSALLAPFLVDICEIGDSCSDYKSPVPVKGHMVHRMLILNCIYVHHLVLHTWFQS